MKNITVKSAGGAKAWMLAAAIGLVVAVGLLEVAGRFYIRYRTRELAVNFISLSWQEVHQYDPDTLWSMRPNIPEMRLPYSMSTNNLGLRNQPLRPKEGQLRVLTLGDSRTFGQGADNDRTWQAILEHNVNETQPNHVEIINAGVSGWASYQGLRYLETRGLALEPDIVIAAFGANDWVSVDDGAGGLVDWVDLTRHSGVKALLIEAARGAANMVHESPFGPRTSRMSPGEYVDAHIRMWQLCMERDIPFYMLYLPGLPDLQDPAGKPPVRQIMLALVGYMGIELLDPRDAFPEAPEAYYVDPVHFNAAGNQVIADYLYDAMPVLSSRPTAGEWETVPHGLLDHPGQ